MLYNYSPHVLASSTRSICQLIPNSYSSGLPETGVVVTLSSVLILCLHKGLYKSIFKLKA